MVVAAIAAAATACGGSGSASNTIRLQPGRYTFHLGGRVETGDQIDCVTTKHAPAGGGVVGKRGHGVGSSTGFSLVVSASGTVTVTCPAHTGST
jgi:hypothetical protein